MAGELQTVPGLLAKHLAVLTDPLNIQTPGDLVRSDRRVVHAAMRRLRPRPTLEDVSGWQDAARDLTTAAADPDWEQAAAFVVSFETRPTPTGPERRVVAEQAEQDAPLPRGIWPGWQCGPVGDWLQDHTTAKSGGGTGPPAVDVDRPGAGTREARARSSVVVDEVAVLDAGGSAVPLLPARDTVVEIPSDARLRVAVAGASPTAALSVALRLRRAGSRSTVPHGPVSVQADEPVEIDLDRFPTGTFDAVLAAWSRDGSRSATVVGLTRLRRSDHPDR